MFKISQLKLAHDDTAAQLHVLLQRAYHVEAELIKNQHFPPLKRSLNTLRQTNTYFYGLWLQDSLGAAIELEQLENRLSICGFAVMPSCFRRGYGKCLLHEILRRYSRQLITVQTAQANVPAINLYQKLGFDISRQWQSQDGFALVELTFSPAKD